MFELAAPDPELQDPVSGERYLRTEHAEVPRAGRVWVELEWPDPRIRQGGRDLRLGNSRELPILLQSGRRGCCRAPFDGGIDDEGQLVRAELRHPRHGPRRATDALAGGSATSTAVTPIADRKERGASSTPTAPRNRRCSTGAGSLTLEPRHGAAVVVRAEPQQDENDRRIGW